MKLVNKILDLKPYEMITNLDDTFIVIDNSGTFTVEVVNVRTGEDETLEGDYLDNGALENIYTKGDALDVIKNSNCNETYKTKITNIVNEIKEFYFS